jgi:hypothetical protein
LDGSFIENYEVWLQNEVFSEQEEWKDSSQETFHLLTSGLSDIVDSDTLLIETV